MDQATRDAVATLQKTVERGFAAVADDITTLRTELKADILSLREQVASIEMELRSIRRDLDRLADQVSNLSGLRKEVDYAFERIVAIERHLGIGKDIRA